MIWCTIIEKIRVRSPPGLLFFITIINDSPHLHLYSTLISISIIVIIIIVILSYLPFPSPFLCYVMLCSVLFSYVLFHFLLLCSALFPTLRLSSLPFCSLLFCFVLYPLYSDLFSSHLICRILLCPDHFHYNMFYRDLKTKLICPAFALSYTDAHCYIRLSHVTECHRL